MSTLNSFTPVTIQSTEFLLALFSIVLTLTIAAASNNFTQCYEIDNKYNCFYTENIQLNWDDAQRYCKSIGLRSRLVTVTDQNIQNALQQFINGSISQSVPISNSDSWWIGARTVNVEPSGQWHWINGHQSNLRPNPNPEHVSVDWCSGVRSLTSDGNLQLEQDWWTDNPPWFICQYNSTSECSESEGFIYHGNCYKKHQEVVRTSGSNIYYPRWFTAVNRCLAKNATLAVFDDELITSLRFPWLPVNNYWGQAWIGLIRSWWTWQDSGNSTVDVLFNMFNAAEGVDVPNPPNSPPQTTNTASYCAAVQGSVWTVHQCSDTRSFICQAETPVTTTSTTRTTTTTTTTTDTTRQSLPTASTEQPTTESKNVSAGKTSNNDLAVGLGVGLGVGLSLVIIIVVIIVVVVVVVVVRRRHNNNSSSSSSSSNNNNINNSNLTTSPTTTTNTTTSTLTNNVNDYDELNPQPAKQQQQQPETVYAHIVPDITAHVNHNNDLQQQHTNNNNNNIIYADLGQSDEPPFYAEVNRKQ